MAHRTRRHSESGFALIEVIVSAAVLAIVAMAVLSGIDAATGSSAREKARAVAANLAEREQERLRGLSVEELTAIADHGEAGVNVVDPVPEVDGVTYNVNSRAEWITDDQGGTPACGNSSKNNEYFHITTTVESAIVGKNVPPVVIDSLVAPSMEYSSTHGILGVKVIDRDGNPLAGVAVKAVNTSPAYSPAQQNTDSKGCVLFRQVPIGTYTITLVNGGFVGTDLKLPTTATQKVSPGVVAFKTIEFDRALKVSVSVQTNTPGRTSEPHTSRAAAISQTHPRRTGQVETYDPGTANPYVVEPLFPFKSGAYSFFTGRCGYQSPDIATGDANYFSSYPGSIAPSKTQTAAEPVTVLQPPLNLRLDVDYRGNAFPTATTSNTEAYAKLKGKADDDCVEPRIKLQIKTWPSSGWTRPSSGENWVVQDTTDFDPGLPYGEYQICIIDRRTSTRRYALLDYDNTKPGGQTPTVKTVRGDWGAVTSCPS